MEIKNLFFFIIFIACPPVHTFCQNCEGYIEKEKIERQILVHMSTLLNNKTYWIEILFGRNFHYLSTCPHFFKKIKRYKKERRTEIERQHLVHMSTLLNYNAYYVETFFRNFHYLSTCPHFFVKILKGTR